MLGRTLSRSDEADPNVAVLSYDAWQRRFGSQPDVLGTTIELRGSASRLLTIVGVLPPSFVLPTAPAMDFYRPVDLANPPQFSGTMFGRLGPGAVLAPFAVDQAAGLCPCGHENAGSAAALVFMSRTVMGMRTTATRNTPRGAGAVKMSLQCIGALTKPACIAGVRVSRPNFNALCGRMKL